MLSRFWWISICLLVAFTLGVFRFHTLVHEKYSQWENLEATRLESLERAMDLAGVQLLQWVAKGRIHCSVRSQDCRFAAENTPENLQVVAGEKSQGELSLKIKEGVELRASVRLVDLKNLRAGRWMAGDFAADNPDRAGVLVKIAAPSPQLADRKFVLRRPSAKIKITWKSEGPCDARVVLRNEGPGVVYDYAVVRGASEKASSADTAVVFSTQSAYGQNPVAPSLGPDEEATFKDSWQCGETGFSYALKDNATELNLDPATVQFSAEESNAPEN